MPLLKNRNKYKKFYRPDGTKYANGVFRPFATQAAEAALDAFKEEFRYYPEKVHTVIELVGVTGGYYGTCLEIIED